MIKSVVSFKTGCDRDYPKLMVADEGLIVLFLEAEEGTVIQSDNYQCGYYAEDWEMSDFTDFNGTVTLSNGSE